MNQYALKPIASVTAPNGTKINIWADDSKNYIALAQVARALGYVKYNINYSLIGLALKNKRTPFFSKALDKVGGRTSYVIKLEDLITFLEHFIKLTLNIRTTNSGYASMQDNARMEAQRLIEIFNREVFGKPDSVITKPIETPKTLPISEELAAYLKEEYYPPLSFEQIPADTLKKLSALEKECGTANVVNAIRTENIIYNCGVRQFLTNDPDESTFEYICEFARNPEEHNLATEPIPYITSKLVNFFKDRVLYMHNYGKSEPLITDDNKLWTDFPNCAFQEFYILEQEIGTEQIIDITNKIIPISSEFRCAIIDAFCQGFTDEYRHKQVCRFTQMIRNRLNENTDTKEDTRMENFKSTDNPVADKPAQSKVPVVTVTDIEDIGDRASYVAKVYGVSLKESLIAATKLKAEEINRDLSPLLEMLA